MRSLKACFFALFVVGFVSAASSSAAPDQEGVVPKATSLELIVFEAPECIYCPLIRRDVLPFYEASPRSRTVPMRFVDLNGFKADEIGLSRPLQILPTMVLIKDGAEVDRIESYIGPELFFHAISRMINRAGG